MNILFLLLIFQLYLSGCSHTLNERKKDDKVATDQGTKTELQLRGPRVVLKHSF